MDELNLRQHLDDCARAASLGNHEAFREIVLATQTEVRLAVAARLRVPDLIEEVVHRTYIAAWQSVKRYQAQEGAAGGLTAWLCGIARHQVLQELRTRARRRQVPVGDIIDLLCTGTEAELEVDDGERLLRLQQCLGRLPAQAAEILRRRYAEGHDLARLAIAYKRGVKVLAQQLQRLREKLRICVEQGVR